MKLRNKKVLLLGATGGIGAAVARELIAQGAQLILVARSESKVNALLHELGDARVAVIDRYLIDFADAQQLDQLQAIARQQPDIDMIVHALGVNSFESYNQISHEKLNNLFNVNLFSLMHVCQQLLPNLVQHKGKLVVVGSTFGSIGFPGFSTYCASKFGLRGYVQSLRRELAGSGVDILYIAPRATNTELNDARIVALNQQLGNAVDSPNKVAQQIVKAVLKNRLTSYIGWPEKLFVFINSINSKLVDKGIAKQLPVINRLLAE